MDEISYDNSRFSSCLLIGIYTLSSLLSFMIAFI